MAKTASIYGFKILLDMYSDTTISESKGITSFKRFFRAVTVKLVGSSQLLNGQQ